MKAQWLASIVDETSLVVDWTWNANFVQYLKKNWLYEVWVTLYRPGSAASSVAEQNVSFQRRTAAKIRHPDHQVPREEC